MILAYNFSKIGFESYIYFLVEVRRKMHHHVAAIVVYNVVVNTKIFYTHLHKLANQSLFCCSYFILMKAPSFLVRFHFFPPDSLVTTNASEWAGFPIYSCERKLALKHIL